MDYINTLNNTNQRKDSFQIMVNHLDTIQNPLIVETGCVRADNDWGAGMSTILFDQYINAKGGELHSVDITQSNVEFARARVSTKSKIYCSDSVQFLGLQSKLWNMLGRKIDLLYLDSYDFSDALAHESSLHHIFEFLAAQPAIGKGTMIAVDDNFGDKGKGAYMFQYMELVGINRLHSGYQWIWKL